MSLEQSVKSYIKDHNASKHKELNDYLDFVIDRIVNRLEEDVEVEVRNSTNGPIEYTVPRPPEWRDIYSVAQMIQYELGETFDLAFTVTFKTKTTLVVHFPQGFFKGEL